MGNILEKVNYISKFNCFGCHGNRAVNCCIMAVLENMYKPSAFSSRNEYYIDIDTFSNILQKRIKGGGFIKRSYR